MLCFTRRGACAALLALSACAAPAIAGIVAPGWIVPSANRINLVGWSSAALDPGQAADSVAFGARLTVTVLDLAQQPIVGMPVVLDFSGCPDVRLAARQSYHQVTVQCPQSVAQAYTNAQGIASFVVMGTLANRGGHPAGCLKFYADSFLGGALGVGVYDQNGIGGMTLADVALVWTDVGSGTFQDRTDFDGNGYLTLADVAYAWTAVLQPFDQSGSPLCP